MNEKLDNIVILGVGNILLTDEGVGVRAVQELQQRYDFPENVELVDGGTQGLWLMSTIHGSDHLIVVDAVMGKGQPGNLYRLERDDLPKELRVKQSAHDSDLIEALNLTEMIDAAPKTCVVIGVQPEDITSMGVELTDTISAKIDEIIDMVLHELKAHGIEPQKKV